MYVCMHELGAFEREREGEREREKGGGGRERWGGGGLEGKREREA